MQSVQASKFLRPLLASTRRAGSFQGVSLSKPRASLFSSSAPLRSAAGLPQGGASRSSTLLQLSNESSSRGKNLALLACVVGGAVLTASLAPTAKAEEPPAEPAAAADASSTGEAAEPGKKKTKKVKVKRRKRKKVLPNPGRLQDIDIESSQVLMMEGGNGARFELQYPVMNIPNEKTFLVNLNLGLDDSLPEKKSCQLGGSVQMGDTLFYCLGDVGGAGRVMGRFNFPITDKLTSHNTMQILPDKNAAVVISDLEFRGSDFTTNAKLRMQPGSPLLELSYFQSVLPKVALGAALSHEVDQENALVFHGRYKDVRNGGMEGHIFTSTVGTNGIAQVAYTHKVAPHFTLATDLNLKLDPSVGVLGSLKSGMQESVFRVGSLYRYNTFQFQSTIDSTGKVASEVQQITNAGLIGFSAEVNQWTNASRFGISLKVG